MVQRISTVRKKKRFSLRKSPAIKPLKPILGLLPALLSIIAFTLMPALINVGVAFTDYNGVLSQTQFVGMRNFWLFFTAIGSEVGNAFWNTIRYALMVILPMQIIAIPIAVLVNKKLAGAKFFRALFFLPSILGGVVISSTFKLVFDPEVGPVATILSLFGAKSAFFGDRGLSLVLIAIVQLWAGFGYSMTIYLAGLQGIGVEYYEAARIDGANSRQQFFRITLPLLWPSVVICLWIAISGSLGMADFVVLLTQGSYNTTTIGYYMYRIVMVTPVNQGQAAAISLYVFLFTASIMLSFNHFVRKRVVEI